MRFAETARRYEVAQHATATRETVSSPLIRMLAHQIRVLSRQFGDDELDVEWAAFMRRLRRIMRELVATPLPPATPMLRLGETVDYLADLLEHLTPAYDTALIARASLCISAIEDLSRAEDNPFGNLVSEILSTANPESSALLVKPPHHDEIGQWLAARHPHSRTITEFEISKLLGLECLVVAGPSLWFPAHLLSAPRAQTICFVHYDAVADRPQPTGLLSGSTRSPGITIRATPVQLSSTDEELDATFISSTVDWAALARLAESRPRSFGEQVSVQANLFLLAGGYAVYLEAEDGPRIDVVSDLDGDAKPRLRGEPTRLIEPGSYIVLRSEGGSGDYIPEIADALLGKSARSYRELQRLWKSALRRTVAEKTRARVDRDLKGLGIASPNLRYRMWSGSLRSEKPEDFRILMDYLGLGDQKDRIWKAMGHLADAHLRAGQEVRKRLEAKMLQSEPGAILKSGRIDVRLEGMDAGTLSVVRVERRSPDQVTLDEDQVRVMFKVEADLWQG
jgi:hypothetical protein